MRGWLGRALVLGMGFGMVTVGFGQAASSAQAKARKAAEAQVGKQQTFVFLRSKMIGLAVPDLANEVSEVSFDESACVMTVRYRDKTYEEMTLGSLDASSGVWDTFDSSPKSEPHKFPMMLRLTFQGVPDKFPLLYYEKEGKQKTYRHATFMFSMPLVADTPEVRGKITNAAKHLITLCGGVADTDAF